MCSSVYDCGLRQLAHDKLMVTSTNPVSNYHIATKKPACNCLSLDGYLLINELQATFGDFSRLLLFKKWFLAPVTSWKTKKKLASSKTGLVPQILCITCCHPRKAPNLSGGRWSFCKLPKTGNEKLKGMHRKEMVLSFQDYPIEPFKIQQLQQANYKLLTTRRQYAMHYILFSPVPSCFKSKCQGRAIHLQRLCWRSWLWTMTASEESYFIGVLRSKYEHYRLFT